MCVCVCVVIFAAIFVATGASNDKQEPGDHRGIWRDERESKQATNKRLEWWGLAGVKKD